MKKILIVGKLNQLVGSLNEHLSTQFHTQMCTDNLEMVKGMSKIFKQDMAIIYLGGIGELDTDILDFLSEYYPNVPVLFVGTADECKCYAKYFVNNQFDFMVRPTTLGLLQQKCEELLKLVDGIEPDEEITLDEIEVTKKNILAVDDSGILLRSVKTMLDTKYDISVANSGMLAIKQAKKKLPDLILLDYEMPEWDGKRTLEEIRNDEELKDIPVVFLTAIADKAHIAAVLELRPEGYLLKPIEQQRLIDTIEKALIKI